MRLDQRQAQQHIVEGASLRRAVTFAGLVFAGTVLGAIAILKYWEWLGHEFDLVPGAGGAQAPGGVDGTAIIGAIGSVLAGVAILAAAVALALQYWAIRVQDLAGVAQVQAMREVEFGSRLDRVTAHARQFFELDYYQSTRRLAWASIERAAKDPEFSRVIASYGLADETLIAETTVGRGRLKATEEEFGWNDAAHRVADMISFFAVLSAHIESCMELAGDESDDRRVRRVAQRVEVYWSWWGPALRFVLCLEQSYLDKHGTSGLLYRRASDVSADFDRLDEFLLARDQSTRVVGPGSERGSRFVKQLRLSESYVLTVL